MWPPLMRRCGVGEVGFLVRLWLADRVAKTHNQPGSCYEADEVDDCCVASPIQSLSFWSRKYWIKCCLKVDMIVHPIRNKTNVAAC